MGRIALVVLVAVVGCVPRPYVQDVNVYQRPGWEGRIKRALLKFSAESEVTALSRSSVTATPNCLGLPQSHRDDTQSVVDGASIVPALKRDFEIALARAGIVATETPPHDVVMEVSIGTVRWSQRLGSWIADEATMTLRDPSSGELLGSVQVAEESRAIPPGVLLGWLGAIVARAQALDANAGHSGKVR